MSAAVVEISGLYRVVDLLDPTKNGAITPERLERLLDEAHREGWDLVTSIEGVFAVAGNGNRALATIRRPLLILRKSASFVPGGGRPATIERLSTGPTVADVVRRAAEAFGVRAIDVLSRPFKKTRHVTRARQVAAYVLRTTGLSYPEIGTALAHMDHTSAMNACRKVEREPDLLSVARSIAPSKTQTGTGDTDRRGEEE